MAPAVSRKRRNSCLGAGGGAAPRAAYSNGRIRRSEVWYRDQKSEVRRESTATTDELNTCFLRDRLDARDEVIGHGSRWKQLTFNEWADWFLERRSKPPFRSAGNHQQNPNALKFLRPVFGDTRLIGDHGGRNRGLPGGRLDQSESLHEGGHPVAGQDQAGHCSPGVPHFVAHAQRGESRSGYQPTPV